jgi:hypothetical protein
MRNFMVEVQNISQNEKLPEGEDFVMIEKAGNMFVVNGSVAGQRAATFFTPPPFETLVAAIGAAQTWAEANNVDVVYVRDIN